MTVDGGLLARAPNADSFSDEAPAAVLSGIGTSIPSGADLAGSGLLSATR